MAQASKKHVGPGTQGKGAGVGGMTDNKAGTIEDNMVLSNRDKSRHSDERGQDSKWIETEQQRDHAANRQTTEQNSHTTDQGISQNENE